MVSPSSRKLIVRHLIDTHQLSERVACKLACMSRTAFRYHPKTASDIDLRERLKLLAAQYSRYGYLMLQSLLKVVNKKHTYRLYTEEGLQVRAKKRKKLHRPRLVMDVPTRLNQRWSMDFVSAQLSNGGAFALSMSLMTIQEKSSGNLSLSQSVDSRSLAF